MALGEAKDGTWIEYPVGVEFHALLANRCREVEPATGLEKARKIGETALIASGVHRVAISAEAEVFQYVEAGQ